MNEKEKQGCGLVTLTSLLMFAVALIGYAFGFAAKQRDLMKEAYERGYAETYMSNGIPAIRWKEPAEQQETSE